VCPEEYGLVELHPWKISILEVCPYKDGSLKLRKIQAGFGELCVPQIKAVSLSLAI
jgi:hypothetical protein